MLSQKSLLAQEVDFSYSQQFRSVGKALQCGVTRDIGVDWDKQAAGGGVPTLGGWARAYQQPGCWCNALARHTQKAGDRNIIRF